MKRTLLLVGGVANALFCLFHLWLGWRLHQAVGLPGAVRGLLEMLNIGGTLMIAFLAYASLARTHEMATTGLGRAASMLALLVYGTRGAGEFVFTRGAQPLIVATCALVACLYLAVLLIPAPARVAVG